MRTRTYRWPHALNEGTRARALLKYVRKPGTALKRVRQP